MEEAIKLNWLIPGLNERDTMTVLMILLDFIIVFIIVAMGSIHKKRRPTGPQNLVEWSVKYICNYADSIIGEKDAPRYYPLLVMLFFYILVGNLLGLIPGFTSPTSSLSVTVTLALMVWLYTWFEGITRKGPIKFFAHYTGGPGVPGPIKPFLFFVELLSDISRPISLSFRLFGNILAKEILLSVLVFLVLLFWPVFYKDVISGLIFSVAAVLRPLIILLGVLISVIQAGVFTLLAATYMAGAAVSHDEHEEAHQ
jgi:F-type H+-transporting ATPase subunit a